MSRSILAAALLICSSQTTAAAEIGDFAYQALIDENGQKLQRVELPLEIMLASTRSNLSDLAVFNTDGKAMPHTLLRTPDTSIDRLVELPFHKFDRFLAQQSKTVTTRQQNQQADSVSELETTETVTVQSVRNDYLIELTPEKENRRYEALELEWQHEPASQLLEVRVEAGNELDRLRTILPRKSLTNSESGDPEWRSISNIPSHNSYLRLTPLRDVTRFELEQVRGRYREILPAPTRTHRLTPELISDDSGEYYFFRFPSLVPAKTMRIIPAGHHSIISGDLYLSSRSDPENRRLIERGFRQHNIDTDDVKPSRPFNMTRLHPYSIWFTSGNRLPAAPQVELAYPQYEIVFLGDGKGPYRLAWGNHESQATNVSLGEMLAVDLDDPEQRGVLVRLGAIEEAGGPERLVPKKALPWKKWLLWTLLLLAAIVTGRMAVRLYREMNRVQQ